MWLTVAPVPVEESPKSQLYDVMELPAPLDVVPSKPTDEPGSGLDGEDVNAEFGVVTVLDEVLRLPYLSTMVSVTRWAPPVENVWVTVAGAERVNELDPSPKFQVVLV